MTKKFIYAFAISLGINIIASMLGAVVISESFTDLMLYLIFGNSLLTLVISPLFFKEKE